MVSNPNSLSAIVYQIMLAGLGAGYGIPFDYGSIALEMFDVPERPEGFIAGIDTDRGKEVAVLVSGGVDSTVMYFMAVGQYGGRVRPFYVDLGQPYCNKELTALEKLGIKYDLIGVGTCGLEKLYWKHIIPGRNLLCLALAAEHITGGEVQFGVLAGEMPERGGDKSVRFLTMARELLGRLPYPVRITTPLAYMTKTDVVAAFLKLDPTGPGILHSTVSCFSGEAGHCGRCQACLRKAMAFINNGLELQTNTPVTVGCKEYIDKYYTLMRRALAENDYSRYSRRRCEQDLVALDTLHML